MTDNPMTRCEQLEAPAVRVEALTAACRETDALAATLGVGGRTGGNFCPTDRGQSLA